MTMQLQRIRSSWQTGFDVKYLHNYGYISWIESAREIHRDIFRKSYFIMDLLFFTIIILSHLFPYLDYCYFVRHADSEDDSYWLSPR